ncbi:MAG TPA: hypothetical protein VGP72_30415 [Planctomycetota bacterium]|jgi:hypothetical protein
MKTRQRETASSPGKDKPARKRRIRAKPVRRKVLSGWDAIEKLIGTVHGPEDLAQEHDHYARGTPKRNQAGQS